MKDLFEDSEELFCPLDGQKLTISKWEWCGNELLICPKGHVWEARWSRQWEHQLEFDVIDMEYCATCRQIAPRQLMRTDNEKTNGRRICPDCHEKIKQAWRPDLEKSHARLIVTPIRRGDKVTYDYEESIEIQPYPNPYGCGGCWGGGTMETEAEMEERIKHFSAGIAEYPFTGEWYGQWKKLGVKFEVIRKPEMTAAEYINERERDYVEEHPEEANSSKHTQMMLIA
jgi:hypothetical protein